MIPSYVLFAMLVGFITHWVIQSKNFKIVTIKNTNLNFFKIGFFIVLSLFLVSAIYGSSAIEHLSEPKTEYFVYPDVEKALKLTRDELPENGIIITQQSRWAITLWDGVPFFTSTGWHDGKLDVNKINQEDIKIITTLMNENYEFFAIKSKTKQEAFFFRYLEREYDLILKNLPTSLCKLEQVSSESKINQNSNDICYGRGFQFVEKFQ